MSDGDATEGSANRRVGSSEIDRDTLAGGTTSAQCGAGKAQPGTPCEQCGHDRQTRTGTRSTYFSITHLVVQISLHTTSFFSSTFLYRGQSHSRHSSQLLSQQLSQQSFFFQ
jgi:hypothetical protein